MEQNQQCPPQSNDVFSPGPSGKSRGVAALLAIFLGSLGIQYFYRGKKYSRRNSIGAQHHHLRYTRNPLAHSGNHDVYNVAGRL